MQLYAGTSKEFIADATRNAIAGKLVEAHLEYYRFNPSVQEIQSWQNSLLQMSNALTVGRLFDHGVVLEYQLPLSSMRLDCMVMGQDANSVANSVIVELKQWSATEESDAEDCVVTYVAGRKRDVLHPSRQVGQYEQYLRDVHTVFSNGEVALHSCAYLHNLPFDSDSEIFRAKHQQLLNQFPAFAGDQQEELVGYLRKFLEAGRGESVLTKVLASHYLPSKKLLEHTANVIQGQQAYVLLDSQQVVFNKVLAQVSAAAGRPRKRTVVLVEGGPGTGKSIIALHLLGALSGKGLNVLHATGSKAFTENMKQLVGRRAAAQFGYTHFNMRGEIPPSHFDALIVDEAHRIRSVSTNRFTRAAHRTGKPQIVELVESAKVSVFFIDDLQLVRPGEEGSAQLVRDTAQSLGAELLEYELDTQFRCGGSDGFINWVDNTLGIRRTANVLWKRDDPYEFKVFDSVSGLEAAIRERNVAGKVTARLAAGFCWPWSDPNRDGTLVPDVKVGDWKMPWNAKPDAGRLAKGIPKANYWASSSGGLEQVGCIYTAQGFEFDYVGVIFGPDVRYDWDSNQWVGDRTKSADRIVAGAGERFLDLVRNTYRVLLTRGIKGCFVHFMDEGTKRFFLSRME